MSKAIEAPARPRTHEVYKREFLERLNACGGKSVLDVGCGDGTRLHSLAEAGWEHCVGVEPDREAASLTRQSGLEVHEGRAEALPFTNASFDLVIFEYTTHHLEHMQRALLEAARVARHSIHVLDCWYDLNIPSQKAASDVDIWLKRLDRRQGMVHNPCPEPREIAAPFAMVGGYDIDQSSRLVLRSLSASDLEEKLQARLSDFAEAPELKLECHKLIDDALLNGISDDGALLFSAVRC